MDTIIAFITGIIEFRSDVTSHFEDKEGIVYDWGREFAHRATFRVWDY